MTKPITALLALLLSTTLSITLAQAADGVISVKSNHDVKTTADNLENALTAKGMTVFTRINHGEGAKKAGVELRPTEVVIFGNPKVGSPLMKCSQTTAIDLPQKALIYRDEAGEVWLVYNDPAYLASRHSIAGCDEVLKKVTAALGNFAKAATQ